MHAIPEELYCIHKATWPWASLKVQKSHTKVIIELLQYVDVKNTPLKLQHHTHINLCAIEYSLGDAHTVLNHRGGMKRVSIFGIWRQICPLPLSTFHAYCWLIKMNLLIKCSSAIWFLTIWTTWENSDFAWEKLILSLKNMLAIWREILDLPASTFRCDTSNTWEVIAFTRQLDLVLIQFNSIFI